MQVDEPDSIPNRFLLFVGGDDHLPESTVDAWAADVVVAVDSGLHVASALGIPVHHVVGDMDSVDPSALAAAEEAGARVHLHPTDKNATDLELALHLVVSLRDSAHAAGTGTPPEGTTPAIHVVGGGGGRLDHLVGDLLMLSGPLLVGWDVTARLGGAEIAIVRPGRPMPLRGHPGDQVSLLPVHGPAGGVSTSGLRWPLIDGYLAAGTSRAISNELEAPRATVTITEGSLVVIQPGTRGRVTEPRPDPYDPTPRPPQDPPKETSP